MRDEAIGIVIAGGNEMTWGVDKGGKAMRK